MRIFFMEPHKTPSLNDGKNLAYYEKELQKKSNPVLTCGASDTHAPRHICIVYHWTKKAALKSLNSTSGNGIMLAQRRLSRGCSAFTCELIEKSAQTA